MIKLSKGNPENLEGKVFAYAAIADSSKFKVGAYIAACNRADLEEIFAPVTQVGIYSLQIEEISVSKIGSKDILAHYYSVFITFDKFPDFSEFQDNIDIINLGEVSGQSCREDLRVHLSKYMVAYYSQIKPAIIVIEKTHLDVPASQLPNYLSNNYISPLIHARNSGNLDEAAKIETDFKRFSEGSGFRHLVPQVCEFVKPQMTKEQTGLLEITLRIMKLVASEEYQKAALYRDLLRLEQAL